MKKIKLLTGVLALTLAFLPIGGKVKATQTTQTTASKVNYTDATNGSVTNLFCNNPERIHQEDLADSNSTQAGNILYQKRDVKGEIQVFFSHMNAIPDKAIKVGVQLYNAGSKAVSVQIEKSGLSKGGMSDMSARGICWNSFLRGSGSKTITIQPNSVYWFESPSGNYTELLEGALQINASSYINISVMAYTSLNNINGNLYMADPCTRNDNIPSIDNNGKVDEGRVYKGQLNTNALQNNLSWIIDNNTSSSVALPVNVNGNISYNGWITNITKEKNPNAYINDISSIYCWNPFTKTGFTYYAGANLGNWGVTYIDNISITNNSTSSKNVSYNMTALNGDAAITLQNPIGIATSVLHLNTETELYRTYAIPPKGNVSFSIKTVLDGNSCGNLKRSVKLIN